MKYRLPVIVAVIVFFSLFTLAQTGAVNVISGIVDFSALTSLTIPVISNAAPTANGVIAYDSASSIWRFGSNGMTQSIDMPIFAQTQSVTVGNSVAETTLIGTGVGSVTLPANYFIPGRVLKVRVLGYHSATGNPTVQIRVKLGGVVILDSTAVISHASTNQDFIVEGWSTCRTAGANGTVFSQGTYTETGNASFGMTNTTTQTINTTGTLAIDVTLQWGTQALGNTSTATNVIIENAN